MAAKPPLADSISVILPIQSLAPEPYDVLKPFQVVVRVVEDQHIAALVDANLSASGDTETEAILNLKDTMIAVYEFLMATEDSELGPGPRRQKAVLREFMRRRD